jgi:Ni2+-binding GTPase involved in maturation of urease and hydrogenase
MKFAIVAGPPASGKSSIILRVFELLRHDGLRCGLFKIDTRSLDEVALFQKKGFFATGKVSRDVCPDHEAVTSMGEARAFALENDLDCLVFETGGLCHRCSPFLKRGLGVTVVCALHSIVAPFKMRPLVEQADVLVLSKSEYLSPMEREAFLQSLRKLNNKAQVSTINGLTGEGVFRLKQAILAQKSMRFLDIEPLRAVLPSGYCHFCQGLGSGYE